MRKVATILTAISFIFAANSSPSIAQSTSDIILFQKRINPVQSPATIFDEVGDGIANPVSGPLVLFAMVYFGAPLWVVGGLGGLGSQSTFLRKGEESYQSIHMPSGYVFCAARFNLTSIVPRSGKRASVVGVGGEPGGASVYTWTPRRKSHEGRSWVDLKIDIAAVKSDHFEQYRDKCNTGYKRLISCKGDKCDAPQGQWLK
ncbi:hypothetical protein [Xanthobacter autotrophicus]|uniref:hypothetical protein n=1 Tax=Xanthobacter autotrophicus TaxID=280 RepID=UPI0024A63409|nr:hypothetical protein [Xanthobacter autotrophicus]MDI4655540.1 hypothetical protein [Xanthobacter autotrophicus]